MNQLKDEKLILVIEDELDILFSIKSVLEMENFKVLIAENGYQAIELLRNLSKPPNLILLDMKMPIMNGWEFENQYRKHFEEYAPIIVMTAAADANKRAQDIEAVDYLTKPFRLSILFDKISRNLQF